MKNKFVAVILVACAFGSIFASTAEAGVLFRSRSFSSRIRSYTPSARYWKSKQSTYAAARQNVIHRGSLGSFSAVNTDFQILKSHKKHQERLYKWNLKKKQKALKEKQKAEQRYNSWLKKAYQESKRNKKETSFESRFGKENSKSESSQGSSQGLSKKSAEKGKKKVSFWARFWKAIFPNSKNS
jgi:hypothetical protein